MRDVDQLRVSQVRIFRPDVIPMRKLLSQFGSGAFGANFGFREVGVNETGDLLFQAGTFLRSVEAQPFWINTVAFNERKMVIQVEGSSEDAQEVFRAISETVAKISPETVALAESPPLLLAEETVCVATLGFLWSDVFARPFRSFIEESLSTLAREGASPFLKTPSVRFQIGYLASPEHVLAGVTFADKHLIIEPRGGTSLDERRFVVHSPTGSETHFRLIQRLEELLGQP